MSVAELGITRIKDEVYKRFNKESFYPSTQELKGRLRKHPAQDEIMRYLKTFDVPLKIALEWPKGGGVVLSDLGIIRHMLAGNIVIHPFNADQLGTNSYDVTLGEYFKRFKDYILDDEEYWQKPIGMYNPFDEETVELIWQTEQAQSIQKFERKQEIKFIGIKPEDKIILIKPGEMILAHTQEFIGGVNMIATKISGTSTAGRNMIEVCNDADFGNIGFFNRWTLEIKNKSIGRAIPLVVDHPYAQITFFESQPCARVSGGKYQKGKTLEDVIGEWNPNMMLPRMKRRENNQTQNGKGLR